MRTLKQIQASRTNGARSQGPVTPAGKARVALNGVQHGITAQTALLSNESHPRFEALFTALIDRFAPLDQAEFLCIEEMAWAKWRLRRAVSFETALLDDELAVNQNHPARESTRAARAFNALHATSPGFRNVQRYETGNHHAYLRALRELLHLQAARPLQSEPKDAEVEPIQ